MAEKNLSCDIVIIGAGILGLMQAYLLSAWAPGLKILLLDSGNDPRSGTTHNTTFGQGRDARHFTGSEGLSLQNPVHSRAVALHPNNTTGWAGWKTITDELTSREQYWQSELATRYLELGDTTWLDNPYNHFHTHLNFAGMECWDQLAARDAAIAQFRMTDKHVYVLFENDEALEADFQTESYFEPRKGNVQYAEIAVLHENFDRHFAANAVAARCLRLSGSTWRIQSLGKFLIAQLANNPNITLRWNNPVERINDLPHAAHYFWTAHGGAAPDIYADHSRVQGLGGFWLTLPNTGFHAPFKISAPQPSGYINLTPDGDALLISAGFGWVGNRTFAQAVELLETTKQQTLAHLSHFLAIPMAELQKLDIGTCIRPSTPTGLPDVKTISTQGRRHSFFSGSGKAGATQAVLLALYAAKIGQIDSGEFFHAPVDDMTIAIIQTGLKDLEILAADKKIYRDPVYPETLVKELKLDGQNAA